MLAGRRQVSSAYQPQTAVTNRLLYSIDIRSVDEMHPQLIFTVEPAGPPRINHASAERARRSALVSDPNSFSLPRLLEFS